MHDEALHGAGELPIPEYLRRRVLSRAGPQGKARLDQYQTKLAAFTEALAVQRREHAAHQALLWVKPGADEAPAPATDANPAEHVVKCCSLNSRNVKRHFDRHTPEVVLHAAATATTSEKAMFRKVWLFIMVEEARLFGRARLEDNLWITPSKYSRLRRILAEPTATLPRAIRDLDLPLPKGESGGGLCACFPTRCVCARDVESCAETATVAPRAHADEIRQLQRDVSALKSSIAVVMRQVAAIRASQQDAAKNEKKVMRWKRAMDRLAPSSGVEEDGRTAVKPLKKARTDADVQADGDDTETDDELLRAGFEGLVADSKRYRDELMQSVGPGKMEPGKAAAHPAEAVA